MALGFGFNKVKVLASAEKFVQQGKLESAIAEYEKIIKEDPKDLTVLNTIGDLCARVGQDDKAAHYFRKVGDQYAQNGFTVKAIAIHKKLTKLQPSNLENVNKLAELYTQQGLFSDARAQYTQVADQLLRSGDNAQAARVFQRILELDPESTAIQSKLADLYNKLGKKDEARNIYHTAAESLHARGSYDAAGEALAKVLAIDPENPAALMLRGMIAADAGDTDSAVRYLGQVPDLDSRPDGLRALLRIKLQSGSMEGVEAVANKLLNVHHDLSGIGSVAQWYIGNNHITSALKLYDRHAEVFLAAGRAGFQESLYPLIARIKDNPEALNLMERLLQASADTSRSAEIMELRAHASAQKGDYRQARDLYLKLSELEPENALHAQNYRQMLSKLGEDPTTRALSPEEAAQAFMVEELDEGAVVVHQNYDPPTEQAIEAALTDAELFASYNVPSKAIPPLEAVLHMAPHDITLNQRLAVLYARGERYGDAARVCQVLSEIYRELGHEKDATRYLEASRKYALRAPGGVPSPPPAVPRARPMAPPRLIALEPEPPPPVHVERAVLPAVEEEAAPSVQEFSFDVPDHLLTETETSPAEAHVPSLSRPPAETKAPVAAPNVEEPTPVETDISGEWESMLSVEQEEASPRPPVHEMPVPPPRLPVQEMEVGPEEERPAPISPEELAERIEAIRHYIDQEVWDAAKRAILDLTEVAPDAPEVTEFIAAVSAGQSRAAAAKAGPPAAAFAPEISIPEPAPDARPEVPEFALEVPSAGSQGPGLQSEDVGAQAHEPLPEFVLESPAASAGEMRPPVHHDAPPKQDAPAKPAVAFATAPARPAPVQPPSPPPPPREVTRPQPPVEFAPAPVRPAPVQPAPPPAPIRQPKAESPLDEILDVPTPKPAPPQRPPVAAVAAAKGDSTEDILTDFLHNLERTDLADFVPRPKPEPVPPAKTSMPPAVPAAAAAPARNTRVNGDMQDAESASVLSDILSELQEETAEPSEAREDPETHYNLGIAFKEMGLLDEAIGELQKVCHALDRGNEFSQPIQAYTWLAQCLVDKGAPEAAVRWYNKALQLHGLDDASRCAIYYDLALAYEASGDKKSALANYMEVYGSNIDFRDVASRIKTLKS
jgi:pilus assembly protein FimV